MLSAALALARDGIIGTEVITPTLGSVPDLHVGERLERLSPYFFKAVMMAELLGDLDFEDKAQKDDDGRKLVASEVKLRVRRADASPAFDDLVVLTRPSNADFARDIGIVGNYADLRAERMPEILTQRTDLLSFFGAIEYLHAMRNGATIGLLSLALDVAGAVAQTMKLSLACPRPIVFAPELQPPIQTPEHATFPSGHATQAFVIATVLTELAKAPIKADDQLFRMAARIAANRTVAGVHFPVDSAAGALLGVALGQYLAARARGTGSVKGFGFDGSAYHDNGATRDFHYAEFDTMLQGDAAATVLGALTPRPAPLLNHLWREAEKEHGQRWI